MELMDARLTDVLQYVQFKRKFIEVEIASFCYECLKAIGYVHSQHRIHRDVRSDNILVNEDGNIKIAEFSLCCELAKPDEKRKSVVGTPYVIFGCCF